MWYDQGHQSLIGTSAPTVPFQPWIQIGCPPSSITPKAENKTHSQRSHILKRFIQLPILQKIQSRIIFIEDVARLLQRFFNARPSVIIFMKKMDIGSLKILKPIWQYNLDGSEYGEPLRRRLPGRPVILLRLV